MDGEKLTLGQEFSLVAENSKKCARGMQKNLNDRTLELAIGMNVMMTYNGQTKVNLVSGARSKVIDIFLNAD